MIRFLRLLLCKRIGKLVLLASVFLFSVSFFLIDNLKGISPSTPVSDDSRIYENLLKRLENIELKVSQLQVHVPLKEQNIIPQNNNQDHHVRTLSKKCDVPSNWRYPFCRDKVRWMQFMWQGNTNCYIKEHGIIPTDDCTILKFLSEAEAWCPLLPGREKPDPRQTRPRAKIRTDKAELMELLKDSKYTFLKDRINRFWPHWVEGALQLQKRKTNLENKASQNILVFMGSFALEPLFFTYAYLGGPLGELVQWSDLITSLYVLGHNLTISSNEKDIPRLLNAPKVKGCASKAHGDAYDAIYTDYNGIRYITMAIGPNHSKYRCKMRVVDSFGTEAEFNFAEYSKPILGGRSPWANADLHLRQIMTMFPHSPDNTFLGFVVDAPPKTVNKPVKSTKPIGLVYGKEARFWKGKKSYLDTLHEYFDLHATLGGYNGGTAAKPIIPDYIVNHGILKGDELKKLLKKSKIFIGLGFPYEGPAPLEAIASGCVFLNAKLDPPQNRLNTKFFEAKPTFRELTSQHPYTEDFIGEPHVFTIDISNMTAVKSIAEKILKTEVKPYIPLEWTPEGMLERMNSFLHNMDFCSKNSKIWPPEDQHQLIKSQAGKSCKHTCMEKGLICESFHFYTINTEDSFKKLEIKCNSFKHETILDAPSISLKDKSCTLQMHPLAFSCVAANPDKIRLCPCRDFQPQQVALCKTCS